MIDADFKKAISEALCDEYIDSIPEHNADHEFSEEFYDQMDKLVKRRKKPYYRFVNTAFKRTAALAAVILLVFLAPLSVKAFREGAYNFIINVFSDHTELSVDIGSDNYPKTIETEYYIPAIEGWDMEVWVNEEQDLMRFYTNGDDVVILGQFTLDQYQARLEKDEGTFIPYTDEYGNEYLISQSNVTGVTVLWNNKEYVFLVYGSFDKEQTLELCRTIEIKENSELLSQRAK